MRMIAMVFATCLLALPDATRGEGVPFQVQRVLVPRDQIGAAFPPGSELISLPETEFEALVAAAQQGVDAGALAPMVTVTRARHIVTWSNGLLRGRSELSIPSRSNQPLGIPLQPWTPAIIDGERVSPERLVRTSLEGRTEYWLRSSDRSQIEVDWELAARPGSAGKSFSMGLPACEVSELVLELPEGLVPVGAPGIRQGPFSASSPMAGRWIFHGAFGSEEFNLRLLDVESESAPDFWVGGTTKVEVQGTTAHWRAEWSIESHGTQLRPLVVQLDETLDLISVEGQGVEAVLGDASTPEDRGRLVIRFVEDTSQIATITILATSKVPAEGQWVIPSARPLGAVWVGVRTVVFIGPDRLLESCRELAGASEPPTAVEIREANPNGSILVFSARQPLPVAELSFRRPELDASVEVNGRVNVGREACRLEGHLLWSIHDGHASNLRIEVPALWKVDEVLIDDSRGTPLTWNTEVGSGGGSELVITAPAALDLSLPRELGILVTANAQGTERGGPLRLPRLRPMGTRISDERWIATTDPYTTICPTQANGLAWLTPGSIDRYSAEKDTTTLAWRWIRPDGDAHFKLEPFGIPAIAEITEIAWIDEAILTIEALLKIDLADTQVDEVAVFLEGHLDAEPSWRITSDEENRPLAARPMLAEEMKELGVAGRNGIAQFVKLPEPRGGVVQLHAHLEQGWDSGDLIPLYSFPGRQQFRGQVLLFVQGGIQTAITVEGLTRLEPSQFRDLDLPVGLDVVSRPTSSTFRLAHALLYGIESTRSRLGLETEILEPLTPGGFIRDAVLSSPASSGSRVPHKLSLSVVAAGDRPLDITLPQNAALLRVTIDGRMVIPRRNGAAISLPVPGATASRPASTIQLEFEGEWVAGEPDPFASCRREAPPVQLSMPCLNFTWEIIAGASLRPVIPPESTLVASEPEQPPGLRQKLLGSFVGFGRRDTVQGDQSTELLEELSSRITEGFAAEISLGELLQLWDSGHRPVIVDRSALVADAWSPASQLRLPELNQNPGTSWHDWFNGLGLEVVPVSDVVLITTREQARSLLRGSADDGALARSIRQALVNAGSLADRFQTVSRWSEETLSLALNDTANPARLLDRSPYWYEGVGWPGPASLSMTWWATEKLISLSWASALSVLGLGFLIRGHSARLRLWVVLLITCFAILGVISDAPSALSLSTGCVSGLIASLAIWMGQGLRAPSTRPQVHPRGSRRQTAPSTTARRVGSASSIVLVMLHLTFSIVGNAREFDIRGEPRQILAILPHDGTGLRLGHVWLLRDDVDRLRALGRNGALADRAEFAQLWALDAEHKVQLGEETAAFESTLVIELTGQGPLALPLPLGEAVVEWAEIDGARSPVGVRDGATMAEVWISGQGRHQVRIRQVIKDIKRREDSLLTLPVLPIASSRVVVDARSRWISPEIVSARGGLIPTSDRELRFRLGPSSKIEIQLANQGNNPSRPPRGSAEGLLLWDAEPAGDRVRARIRFNDLVGATEIRVGLGTGMIVRSATLDGLVAGTMGGDETAPIWIARLDPPITGGAVLSLDLWRPFTPPVANDPAISIEPLSRQFPVVEPLDIVAYNGLLGLRRPPSWSGRLAQGLPPTFGLEQIPDEQFVRTWGELPSSPSTFAGAVRFARSPDLHVRIGPSPPRTTVQPTIDVLVQPGRLSLICQAVLTSDATPEQDLEIRVPPELQIILVASEDLAYWQRSDDGRIRLRFDDSRRGPGPRRVRIEGWIGTQTDPMNPRTAYRESAIPWLEWLGAEQVDGILRVSTESGISLGEITGSGLVPSTFNSSGMADPLIPSGPVTEFTVADCRNLGKLRWLEPGPRIRVLVRSQITIHPDSAEFTATLRYEVSGGPLRDLVFRMPTTWSENATVETSGLGRSFRSTNRGDQTEFDLDLDEPVWGTREFLIRATHPFVPSRGLILPDIVPMMPKDQQEGFDTYLLLVDSSGLSLAPSGSSEVQPIDPARFGEFHQPPPKTSRVHAYRVLKDGWRVSIQPTLVREGDPENSGSIPISWAEVRCNIAEDGASTGWATYHVRSRHEGFLPLVLPPQAQLIAATVDQRPVRPLKSDSGVWHVPIGSAETQRVSVAWQSKAMDQTSKQPLTIPLPIVKQSAPRTVLTIHSPDPILIDSGPFRPVTEPLLEQERLTAMARQIIACVDSTKFDRSLTRDRSELLGKLVNFQLQRRTAERVYSHFNNDKVAKSSTSSGISQGVRIDVIEAELKASLEAVGLDDFWVSSRVRVGESVGPDPLFEIPAFAISSSPFGMRRLGRPYSFLLPEDTRVPVPTSLSYSPLEPSHTQRHLRSGLLMIVGLLCFGLAVTRIADRCGRVTSGLGSIGLVGVLAYLWPLASLGGVLLIGLGWALGRRAGVAF